MYNHVMYTYLGTSITFILSVYWFISDAVSILSETVMTEHSGYVTLSTFSVHPPSPLTLLFFLSPPPLSFSTYTSLLFLSPPYLVLSISLTIMINREITPDSIIFDFIISQLSLHARSSLFLMAISLIQVQICQKVINYFCWMKMFYHLTPS